MFIRNLDAFTQAFGVQHAPVIFSLSQIPWKDDDDRNDFIFKLTGVSVKAKGSYVN